MLHLNVDHLYKRYHHDWRIRDLQKSNVIHGAVSVGENWSGYLSDDGTRWLVFQQATNDRAATHKYRLVFHDIDDGYFDRYIKDDQELYQFFDSFKFNDLNPAEDLTSS